MQISERWAEAAAVLFAALSTAAALWWWSSTAEPVTAPPVLATAGDGYEFLRVDPGSGEPVRFDPCTPIRYVVNPEGAPFPVDDVHEALQRVHAASGIPFAFEGLTDEVPVPDRRLHQPERYGEGWAPVLFGWVEVDPAVAREQGHRGTVLGWSTRGEINHPRAQDVVVTGVVGLNRDARGLGDGFGAGRRWGTVLLHEIGHLLGLGHVDDPGQIMFRVVGLGSGGLGEGDLAGLARLGREAGCLRIPSPSRVELELDGPGAAPTPPAAVPWP